MTSKAEREFTAKYPYARVTEEPSGVSGMTRYTVLAGDYLCADGLSRADAFKHALEYEREGLITPDPAEMAK